jgi:hypothetical protein
VLLLYILFFIKPPITIESELVYILPSDAFKDISPVPLVDKLNPISLEVPTQFIFRLGSEARNPVLSAFCIRK